MVWQTVRLMNENEYMIFVEIFALSLLAEMYLDAQDCPYFNISARLIVSPQPEKMEEKQQTK